MYSKTFAYLLWLISGCGWLGLHRFYLRKPLTGVLWACTGGLCGIGSIYDLVTLGSQVDRANMQAALFHTARAGDFAAGYAYGAAGGLGAGFGGGGFGAGFGGGGFGAGFGGGGGSRYAADASSRIIREKNTPEQAILRLAKKNNGVITPAGLALETGVTLDEAKKQLETLSAKGHIDMRVKNNGSIVFTVNEFLQDESEFEV